MRYISHINSCYVFPLSNRILDLNVYPNVGGFAIKPLIRIIIHRLESFPTPGRTLAGFQELSRKRMCSTLNCTELGVTLTL